MSTVGLVRRALQSFVGASRTTSTSVPLRASRRTRAGRGSCAAWIIGAGMPGEVPFAVKVTSLEDRLRPVVEEGSLLVGPFADLGAGLVPRTSSGVRGGKHELAFDNYGNTPVTGTLSATDPDVLLHFKFEPAA